jgi:hypothetical protein
MENGLRPFLMDKFVCILVRHVILHTYIDHRHKRRPVDAFVTVDQNLSIVLCEGDKHFTGLYDLVHERFFISTIDNVEKSAGIDDQIDVCLFQFIDEEDVLPSPHRHKFVYPVHEISLHI